MPENKPIYTSNPNDPRLKAYRDSMDLYKYYAAQQMLEPMDIMGKFASLAGMNPTQKTKDAILFNKAKEIMANNPNITMGSPYMGVEGLFVGDNIEDFYKSSGSTDLITKDNSIMPSGSWMGSAINNRYEKPVQPIILKNEPPPKTNKIEPQTHHPVVHHYQKKHYPDKTPQEIHDHIFNKLYPDIPKEVVQAAMDKKMNEINQTMPSAQPLAPIVKPTIPQPLPRLYQGYRFMQATGLKPDYYTDEQILEAMQKRNKPIDAELLKKQGQSYFNY